MRNRIVVAAFVALAGSAACAQDEPTATASPDPGIAITLKDFAIVPAEPEAAAGRIRFELTNDGPSDHRFALVRTDLPEDALPVADHVVEVGSLEVVAEIERISFEAEHLLAVELDAGDYVMLCTIAGHYESDMHASFTVT